MLSSTCPGMAVSSVAVQRLAMAGLQVMVEATMAVMCGAATQGLGV